MYHFSNENSSRGAGGVGGGVGVGWMGGERKRFLEGGL